MADTKLTALTAETTTASTDIFYFVDDPSGTPLSRKITRANLSAGVEADLVGQEHMFIPASAMVSRVTSGGTAGQRELATNDVMIQYMALDAAADEFVQFAVQMPKNWDEGTLVAQVIWTHNGASTNFGVTFAIQAGAFADGDAGDTAFGTAVTIDDTGGTNDDIYITPESSAITVAGTPGAEEWVSFQLYRDVSDANDDMTTADADVIGVKIHYTVDTLNCD